MLATTYFDKLHREHDDALGAGARAHRVDSTKKALTKYKRAFEELDAGDGDEGERKSSRQTSPPACATARPGGRGAAPAAARRALAAHRQERHVRVHSALALVEPHDRVVIHYTRPECIGVGSVQPKPDDEFATGVNIRASVCEHDGTIIDAVVPAESVQVIDQDNLEDVLQMVLAKDNLAGLAKRAKGKNESTAAFAQRVATQTLADLKSSNVFKKQTHLVDACEALYAPALWRHPGQCRTRALHPLDAHGPRPTAHGPRPAAHGPRRTMGATLDLQTLWGVIVQHACMH